MWGDQETGAMEYYSESANTEPKLIDFFKCEAPLREDHGGVGEQTCGNPRLGGAGNGASQTLPAIADGGRTMKREPPSGIFVDFLGRNGDHHVAVSSRSSSDDAGKRLMAPKWIQEAVARDQWSLITARPSLPNLALKLLSPSPTGTQASGTSPPKTPTFDMELNSRTRSTQPCVTTVPDHEGESSTVSADSDRRLTGNFLPDVAEGSNSKKGDFNGKAESRVHRWSPKNSQKRLKILASDGEDDDDDDGAAMAEGSKVESGNCRKLPEKDEQEEKEAVVQAAASLLSLSSNEDDWRRTPSTKKPVFRRHVSSSSLAVIGEGSVPRGNGTVSTVLRRNGSSASSLAAIDERESGESGSFVGCSSGSVLSRPSNKRRYRSVVDVLAESPRVR